MQLGWWVGVSSREGGEVEGGRSTNDGLACTTWFLDDEHRVQRPREGCKAFTQRNEALYPQQVYVCIRNRGCIRFIQLVNTATSNHPH